MSNDFKGVIPEATCEGCGAKISHCFCVEPANSCNEIGRVPQVEKEDGGPAFPRPIGNSGAAAWKAAYGFADAMIKERKR